MQSQQPDMGTGSKVIGKGNSDVVHTDDVMTFIDETVDRKATRLDALAAALAGMDQGALTALTIEMIEPGEGDRSSNPMVYITTRRVAGNQAQKEFDLISAYPVHLRGQRFHVLSALWIDEEKVVITGTRELRGFATSDSVSYSGMQMLQLARALRGVQNPRKGTASDRTFLAGADIDPTNPSKGDITSVYVDIESEQIISLDGASGGLIAVDTDPLRGVLYALRYGGDGRRRELVESDISSLKIMPHLFNDPNDPADWRVIVTAPRDKAFYYGARSNRIGDDTYRSMVLTCVHGYVVTVKLDGTPIALKASDLTYVGPMTYIGRFRSLEGSGMGGAFIDRSGGTTAAPSIRLRGGEQSVPAAFHDIVGYSSRKGTSASASAAAST